MALGFNFGGGGFGFSQSKSASQGIAETKRIETASVVVAVDESGDFTTIQEAIDSLNGDGGLIQVKEGTYIIKESITIPSNIHINGTGENTEVLYNGTTSSTPIFINSNISTGNVNIFISSIKLRDISGEEFILGIDFTKVTESNISECFFEDLGSSINLSNCSNFTLNNNFFIDDANDEGAINLFIGNSRILIMNNIFSNSDSGDIHTSSTCDEITIIGNVTPQGISIRGDKCSLSGNLGNLFISGDFNSIINNRADGGDWGQGLYYITGDRNIITGNVVLNNDYDGIGITGTKNIITNNIIYGNNAQINDAGTSTTIANNITS